MSQKRQEVREEKSDREERDRGEPAKIFEAEERRISLWLSIKKGELHIKTKKIT